MKVRTTNNSFGISLALIVLGVAILSCVTLRPAYSVALPPFATTGAFANYAGDGGFIAFMSGVSGNISYFVSGVFPNGSMTLEVTGNLSLGTEVGIPTSNVSLILTDQSSSPKYFPAVSPADFFRQINFQNISCNYVGSSEITVPAGIFNSVEYQGTGVNGSVLDFWFDNATGLALQMSGSAAELQLTKSNIAQPLALQSPANATLPIIAVFVVGWAFAGALFYAVRRYYLKKNKTDENPLANRTNSSIAKNKAQGKV